MGVKDGSIVDLTPPDPSLFVAKEPDAKEPEDTDEEETGDGEEIGGGEEVGEVVIAKPKKPRNTHGLQK
jgi:hypothetical protein